MESVVSELIRFAADWLMLPIIAIAGYALLFRVRSDNRYEIYTRIFMAGLTSYLVAKLVSLVFQPASMRPFELLGVDPGAAYLNNPGFPSDHALFAMFLTLAVWYAVRSKPLAVTLLLLTLLVCIGRVLALVHTPLDVLGGLLVACVGIVWYRRSGEKIVQ